MKLHLIGEVIHIKEGKEELLKRIMRASQLLQTSVVESPIKVPFIYVTQLNTFSDKETPICLNINSIKYFPV